MFEANRDDSKWKAHHFGEEVQAKEAWNSIFVASFQNFHMKIFKRMIQNEIYSRYSSYMMHIQLADFETQCLSPIFHNNLLRWSSTNKTAMTEYRHKCCVHTRHWMKCDFKWLGYDLAFQFGSLWFRVRVFFLSCTLFVSFVHEVRDCRANFVIINSLRLCFWCRCCFCFQR